MATSNLPKGLTEVRSTYLQKVTEPQDRGAKRRVLTRVVLVIVCAAFLLFFFAALRSKILPDLIARPFYAAHDYVLLPFIGYTFTLFFPWSLVWWGVALIFFLIWLVSYLGNRSLLRPFYYGLCRLVLAEQVWGIPLLPFHDVFAGALVAIAHRLRRLGIQPHLFANVAQREYLKTAHELVTIQEHSAQAHLAQRLQRIAALQIRLRALSSVALTPDHLHAAVLWSQTLVYARYFGQDGFLSPFLDLEKLFIGPLQHCILKTPDGKNEIPGTLFGLASLGADLSTMATLASAVTHTNERLKARILLIENTHARQAFLQEFVRRFENSRRMAPLDASEKHLFAVQTELEATPPALVCFAARLALNIAQFVAKGQQWQQKDEHVAELALTRDLSELVFELIETFDALHFVLPFAIHPPLARKSLPPYPITAQLQLMLSSAPHEATADEGVVHRQALSNLPDEQDYRISALLAEEWRSRRAQAAQAELAAADAKLRDTALNLMLQQESTLQLARGPQPRGEM